MVTGSKQAVSVNVIDRELYNSDELKSASILLSESGCSVLTRLQKDRRCIALKHYEIDARKNPVLLAKKLKEIFEDFPWLKEKESEIKLAINHHGKVLVPASLYQESQARSLLNFHHHYLPSDRVLSTELTAAESYLVYSVSHFLYETASRELGREIQFEHAFSTLINELIGSHKNNSESILFAHVHDRYLDLIHLKGGQISLANTFHFQSAEDYLYYLLFAMEQEGLNPETTKLVLLGDVYKDSRIYELSFQYVRNVSFWDKKRPGNESFEFNELAPHLYFTLFRL